MSDVCIAVTHTMHICRVPIPKDSTTENTTRWFCLTINVTDCSRPTKGRWKSLQSEIHQVWNNFGKYQTIMSTYYYLQMHWQAPKKSSEVIVSEILLSHILNTYNYNIVVINSSHHHGIIFYPQPQRPSATTRTLKYSNTHLRLILPSTTSLSMVMMAPIIKPAQQP